MTDDLSGVFESSTAAELDDMFYNDTESEVASLTDSEVSTARDKRDSLRWYLKRSRQRGEGGWSCAIEECQETLEDLTGTSDLDELDRMLGSEDEDRTDSREAELKDLRDTAEWLDDHGWESEHLWDELAELKEEG